CVKHFPGGAANLELTEMRPVKFEDPEPVREAVQLFRDVFAAPRPPEAVMLSHASYPAEAFDDASAPEGSVPFGDIPASLNPAIVDYLRHQLGYRGLIIGDWYDMGAIERFVVTYAAELGLEKLPDGHRPFVLAVAAGV